MNKKSGNFLNKNSLSSDQILHQAIADRDLEVIDQILNKGEGWKATNNEGNTVLHLAFKNTDRIYDKQQKIIKILESFLNEALSVNIKNAAGQSVLFLATEHRLRHVIDFLLQNKVNLDARDQSGNSIIHFLIEDMFLKYWERCENHESSELRQIFEHKDIDFIAFMMSKGINVDCKNNIGKTPLDLAIDHNLQHVMPTLIRHMKDVKYLDKYGRTLIEVFFNSKTFMTHRQVLEPVYIYSRCYGFRYEIDIVKFLLNKGVSVDNIDHKGNTLVHTFLRKYDDNPEIIRWMLQRYTKVNAQDQYGDTALLLVISNCLTKLGDYKKNTIDFVHILLKKNADVNLGNKNKITPLRQSIFTLHMEVIKALVERGADLSPAKNGLDLLHEICKRKSSSYDEKTYAAMIDKLIQAGYDVNAVCYDYTPLMLACRYSCPIIAQKLIDYGANVKYNNSENMQPIHAVANGDFYFSSRTSEKITMFKLLVDAGADINVKNGNGDTVLHMSSNGDICTIRTLINLGADVEVSNDSGSFPLHEFINHKNVNGIEVLLESGADVNDDWVLTEMAELENDDEDMIQMRDEMYEGIFDGFYNLYGDDRRDARNDDIIDSLTEHWIKLKVANLPAMDGFKDYAKKDSHQEFYTQCLAEIETLKAHWLDGRTSLYNLLHMDIRLKSGFIANNSALKQLVQLSSLPKSFPKYHTLIKATYNRAIIRYLLIEPAKQAWYNLTDIYLPDVCVERILTYLRNQDLRMMIEEEEEEEIKNLKRPSNEELFNESAKKKKDYRDKKLN